MRIFCTQTILNKQLFRTTEQDAMNNISSQEDGDGLAMS